MDREMSSRPSAGQVGLVYLLLLVAAAELAVNRLAVPTLLPRGNGAPPVWHEVLSYVGLFLLYFASTLAVGVLVGGLAFIALIFGAGVLVGWVIAQ